MKTCFKCGLDKPLSEFYKHKQMKDGHLGKCKSCTKLGVKKHREDNLDKVREYDRARSKTGHRKDCAAKKQLRYREQNQQKYKAHCKVSNAIRNGRIIRPDSCDVCGVECVPHGHHWSYEEEHWLDVDWVCVHCHIDLHRNF